MFRSSLIIATWLALSFSSISDTPISISCSTNQASELILCSIVSEGPRQDVSGYIEVGYLEENRLNTPFRLDQEAQEDLMFPPPVAMRADSFDYVFWARMTVGPNGPRSNARADIMYAWKSSSDGQAQNSWSQPVRIASGVRSSWWATDHAVNKNDAHLIIPSINSAGGRFIHHIEVSGTQIVRDSIQFREGWTYEQVEVTDDSLYIGFINTVEPYVKDIGGGDVNSVFLASKHLDDESWNRPRLIRQSGLSPAFYLEMTKVRDEIVLYFSDNELREINQIAKVTPGGDEEVIFTSAVADSKVMPHAIDNSSSILIRERRSMVNSRLHYVNGLDYSTTKAYRMVFNPTVYESQGLVNASFVVMDESGFTRIVTRTF